MAAGIAIIGGLFLLALVLAYNGLVVALTEGRLRGGLLALGVALTGALLALFLAWVTSPG